MRARPLEAPGTNAAIAEAARLRRRTARAIMIFR